MSYPRLIHQWATTPASDMTKSLTYRLVATELYGDGHTERYAIETLVSDSMGKPKWDLLATIESTLEVTHLLAAAMSQLAISA